MRALLLALAVAGLAGCAPAPTAYEVRVSSAWDDIGRREIAMALDAWTKATGVRFTVTVQDWPCPGDGCFGIRPTDRATPEADCHEDGAIGCKFEEPGDERAMMLDVDPDPQWDTVQIITHEVGHALGLKHDQSEDAIMYRNIHGSQTITERDVAQYWSVR